MSDAGRSTSPSHLAPPAPGAGIADAPGAHGAHGAGDEGAAAGAPARDRKWYIVHTYSGFEERVKETLRQRAEALDMGDAFGEIRIAIRGAALYWLRRIAMRISPKASPMSSASARWRSVSLTRSSKPE